MNELWTEIAARAGLTLSDTQHALLAQHLDLLLEANLKMNLTRITQREKAEVLHVADALTALPLLPAGPHSLADLGSGGGVPGIPLAIARPDVQVLLIESTKKKAAFLRQAVETLGLKNVAVSEERVEDVGRSDRREQIDVVTARAVGLLPWLIEWAVPLLRVGGKLLAYKGERAGEEIASSALACKMLHVGRPIIHPIELLGTEGHVIVAIEKIRITHPSLPRSPTHSKGKHL